MEQYYTRIRPVDYRPKITYADGIFMAGSCFAEHISHKLEKYKYAVLSNPFGILYNPASLNRSFKRIVGLRHYTPDELIFHDGLFHSMDHHGKFSGTNAEDVITNINSSLDQAHDHLVKSKFVFISLGTAKIFISNSNNEVVGNCHKIPQNEFTSQSLSVEECVDGMKSIHQNIKEVSPAANVLWTISPVRYLREGFVENQRSKATLILAVQEFLKETPGSGYFPAYEIMMDQLRDYRFYAPDMVHPSEAAIDIIWDHFCEVYVDHTQRTFHSSIEKITKARNHRILHQNQERIATFAKSQLRLIEEINSVLPDLNFKEEKQYFFHLTEPD